MHTDKIGGNGMKTVEPLAQFLSFFQGEEFFDGHRLAKDRTHAAMPNALRPRLSPVMVPHTVEAATVPRQPVRGQHSIRKEETMAKAYWISAYRSISSPEKLAAYAKLAGPSIAGAGGRFLARGVAAKTYEAGVAERTVLIEFDSVAQAIAAHDSPGYQAALEALGDGAVRDIRIVEGV